MLSDEEVKEAVVQGTESSKRQEMFQSEDTNITGRGWVEEGHEEDVPWADRHVLEHVAFGDVTGEEQDKL